jgi:hypothetical protein
MNLYNEEVHFALHIYFVNHLKGHGNETDFLGFLQKLVPRESLPFEPFRFWRLLVSPIWGVADSAHD